MIYVSIFHIVHIIDAVMSDMHIIGNGNYNTNHNWISNHKMLYCIKS
uniref:Uncharacterized protein n=1 Tax=Anguilla anguilla TaxID=7936 RepID=A0A0E9VV55_ANGAN